MTSTRDTSSRLRQALNPLLTTSLGGYHNQLNTPHSAVSTSTPHAFGGITPASTIQPYNPQQWVPSPAVGPERTHQFPVPASFRDGQPPTSAPAPPPPYSPPRSQRPAGAGYETPPANTSAARVPASSVHRPSPEPSSSQSFPPPPGSNGRGGSRERRFGLSSLTRRRDRDTNESSSPPDNHPPPPLSRPQTLMINIPQAAPGFEGDILALPPNARRAASASAIETPTSARSRSTSQSRWGPGMPIPPPPPGPPPLAQSRSQSLNRTTDPIMSPPTRRPPPSGLNALGPVPPTPANWIDEDAQGRGRSPNQPELTIDTSSATGSSSQGQPQSASAPSSGGGLNRTGAVRGEKTLRERRNESRTRHQRNDSGSDAQPLSDIVVPSSSSQYRRVSTQKGTPRSGGRQEGPRTSEEFNIDSRHSTPRPSAGLHPETPTPPFSPHPQKGYPVSEQSHPMAPKALPTPPPQSRSASSSSQVRPEISALTSSITPAPVPAQLMTKQMVVSQTADKFCQGSIERFRAFAEQEASAKSDADRVKLFADFIVNESRLRRERYSSAIGAMGSEIFDLTRDLFRPMKARRDSSTSQSSEWTPQVAQSSSQRNSLTMVPRDHAQSSPAPTASNLSLSPVAPPPANGNWASQYMPSLSPILSMSVSEAFDESGSRGRPSSRWWEGDSNGDANRLERTKRESKYMGVPKEAREALQWQDAPTSIDGHVGSSKRYSADEYPPEKAGWHESEQSSTSQQYRNSLLSIASSAPNTPSPSHLDISRLVTLPPPYPRHHPAVNNNHPELSSIRTLVRAVSDLTEVQSTKEKFAQESLKARDEAAQAIAKQRQVLRTNLQQGISQGNMSYAEAAAIEADTQETERAQAKELEKKEFERFQTAVVMPLNELLTDRIRQATSLFDSLRSRLFVETQAPNPNMPQEEGDEQPELLEKLTLLKWIFEAREALHREIYDLLSDRNDRYRAMVLAPYRQSGNAEKLRSAEAFFAEDAGKRRAAFAAEALHRAREFRGVVEENVERGVDMQLNAFWDLAPPLRRLLDKIPGGNNGNGNTGVLDHSFRIQIPAAEYEENPAYHAHPLQYLYSLLLHAEKSSYQFIESQTNLLCLLHEVKEAVMVARAKVAEAEAEAGAGAQTDLTRQAVEEERRAEQERLTEDLKEKVRVVQDQWEGALGEAMRGVKERVGEWLLQTGGWDESLEDGGVGGV
ncbi:hypothetical protein F4775DRAFT_585695 [Biscogniauxia sp. FL1348]|nr:hypothetical protein F4775DRAFT_585695 [Biscogniauxia sp. FL1348]